MARAEKDYGNNGYEIVRAGTKVTVRVTSKTTYRDCDEGKGRA